MKPQVPRLSADGADGAEQRIEHDHHIAAEIVPRPRR
jgi:hypothetical protein